MRIHFTSIRPTVVNMKPQSLEAERALIGGLLLDHEKLGDVLERICGVDFIHPWHRKLFEAICHCYVNYKAVDIAILSEVLGTDKGELQAIYELVESCASTANLLAYADIIKEKSVQRKLIEVSDEVFQNKKGNRSNNASKIAKFEKKLSNGKSKPCESPIERLAMFFEETAAEIRSIEVDTCFMMSLIAEVTKAMVRTHDEVEREEDRDNAS